METSIRKAVLEDFDGLCAVIDEVDQLHREKLPGFFRKPPDGSIRTREYIQSLLEDPDTCVLVAESAAGPSAGEIVGAIITLIRNTPPIPILVPRRFAVIDNLVVREACREKGIASALIASAEAWAREAGAETVELSVYLFNRNAIHLYEALGYAGISQRMVKGLTASKNE